ncbi:hypothetical protein GA0115251_10241, partial [Streptomyces sp. TverLS-915]
RMRSPARGAGGIPNPAGADPSRAGADPSQAGADPSRAGADPSQAGADPGESADPGRGETARNPEPGSVSGRPPPRPLGL